MDPITQTGGTGGSEVIKKMMEQGQGAPGEQQVGQGDKLSSFEKVRQGQLEDVKKSGEVDETSKAEMRPSQRLAGFLDHVNSGQHKLDSIIKDLGSGKKFEMKELMTMQLQVQQLSQQMSMTTKLIGKAIENINKAINTQV